jgi:hypothetical protein
VELVWYVAYGSNCSAERFQAYLSGGTATGAGHGERGARDPRPPRQSAAHWFDAPVRFIGDAAKWGGGGIAFLDHEPGESVSPGRRYLITKDQFDDVVAQESRRPLQSLPIDDLIQGRVHPVGNGRYDGLLGLGNIKGIPVMTFTSPRPLLHLPVSAPSATYLGTVARGLAEVHDLDQRSLAEHLHRAPGVEQSFSVDDIIDLLDK